MSNTYKRSQDAVIGKIVSTALLQTTSPLLIASGQEGDTDKDILLWEDNKPYIPSTSITGVIRSHWEEYYSVDQSSPASDYFWGSRDSNQEPTYQSHFVIDDLLMADEAKVVVNGRDGVRMNLETGTAADQGKYDYQVLESQHGFQFRIEATIRKGVNIDEIKKEIEKIYGILQSPLSRIGALTTTGFGQFEIRDIQCQIFDFKNNNQAAKNWFLYLKDGIDRNQNTALLPKSLEQNYIEIEGEFELVSSLITGAYPSDPESPDKVQLKSGNNFILSGKALKGAIRHRAQKILNTVGVNKPDIIHNMMGYVDDNSPEENAIKSRLWIDETILSPAVQKGRQDRIKIDRWSGAVINGAKFDSEPVWKNNESAFKIKMLLIPQKKEDANEVTLLLQVLKDLWTGDLAVGGEKNVGRGVMKGHRLSIKMPNGRADIVRTDVGIDISDKKGILQKYNKEIV